jgi:hypothetical protein
MARRAAVSAMVQVVHQHLRSADRLRSVVVIAASSRGVLRWKTQAVEPSVKPGRFTLPDVARSRDGGSTVGEDIDAPRRSTCCRLWGGTRT